MSLKLILLKQLRALVTLLLLATSMVGWGQMNFTTTGAPQVIDFESTIAGVNNGTFNGTGFTSSPAAGQLDSDAWAYTGMSSPGTLSFGGSQTLDDAARGTSTGGVSTGGFYAFDAGSGDIALGIQPGGSDWTPGTVTLLITNNTGSTVTSIDVSYNIMVYNDQARANSLNFSHSADNSSYTDVGALDYTTTEVAAGSPSWETIARSTTITGLSLADGASYYLRWSGHDVSGSGSRDEYGIDDISVTLSSTSAITSNGPGNWNTGATWVGGVSPTTGDDVVIAHDVNVTQSVQVENITVQSSQTLTIQSGATLTLSGDIINNGTITVESGGSLVQSAQANNNSGTGTYNVQRVKTFQDHTRFSFWSSPVNGETAEDVFVNTNTADWIQWDYTATTGSNGGDWVYFYNQAQSTTLLPGIGYGFTPTEQSPPSLSDITDTRTFSSSTINNGDIDVTLTGSSADDFALLGNPYSSDLEISEFLNDNDQIENAIYIWSDHNSDYTIDGGYYTINNSGISSSAINQPNAPSANNISPMQGFFVQLASTLSDRVVHFNNSQRTAGNSLFLKTDLAEYLWLSLEHQTGPGNQVVVGLKDDAISGYAEGEDSPSLKMNATMQFYVSDPLNDLTIEYRPKPEQTIDYIPLGLDAWSTGDYTFSIDSTRNWDAAIPTLLLDSLLGQLVNLYQTDYTFNVITPGPIRDRFYLVLDGANVGVDETDKIHSWYWYQSGSQLYVQGANILGITLRNMQGQKVAAITDQRSLSLKGIAHGVYMLSVQTNRGTSVKKIVIK